MSNAGFDVVTGAYSYSGRYITRQLLDKGRRVITLTGHPHNHNPFGRDVMAYPYNFHDQTTLARTLTGADTLYVTYWVRFEHGATTFAKAVKNTKILFDAAKDAGVKRVVYVSITNPSLESDLPYFSGKAELEAHLHDSGLSYAIVRPAVLFGASAGEDVLINNIAWLLRRLPLFGVIDGGDYNLQPIHVEDLARIMVEAGESADNITIDAVGPEMFGFGEMVQLIHQAVGSKAQLTSVSPLIALAASSLLGALLGDRLLTRDEIVGLMSGRLESFEPPRGTTALSGWIATHADQLGTRYSNEVGRHFRG